MNMLKGEVTILEKIGYGLGDTASSMFWKLFGTYLMFFYTDVFGISAAAAGTMFLITRIWDSFIDPAAGIIADRTRSRWGKFRPYLLWFSVPFAIFGTLVFYTPGFEGGGKLIWAYVTYGIMMLVYSAINVPYASLLGVMTSDLKTRTALSSYRMIFAFIGSILALLLIEPLVRITGNGNPQKGWLYATGILAILACILFLFTFFSTKERIRPVKESQNSFKDDISDLLHNKAWWILLGACITAVIFNSIRDGAAVYYFKYYVSGDNSPLPLGSGISATSLYLTIGQAANIAGILLVTPVSAKIGKKTTFFWATMLAAVLSIAFYFVKSTDFITMMILQVFISACAGSIFPLLWSMYADIADWSELRTGRRATGLIFSSSSMSQKFGWAIGGTMTGWILAYFGFEANTVQDKEVLESIRNMMSMIPAAAALISCLFMAFYPLTEKIMGDTETRLSKMRNASKTE